MNATVPVEARTEQYNLVKQQRDELLRNKELRRSSFLLVPKPHMAGGLLREVGLGEVRPPAAAIEISIAASSMPKSSSGVQLVPDTIKGGGSFRTTYST